MTRNDGRQSGRNLLKVLGGFCWTVNHGDGGLSRVGATHYTPNVFKRIGIVWFGRKSLVQVCFNYQNDDRVSVLHSH
jgi:hypothetical protein